MKASRLAIALALCALLLAAPAQAAGFFDTMSVTGYANQSMDIDDGDLYSAGVMLGLAAPLKTWDGGRLEFRLEGLLGAFWDYGSGVEVAILPGLRVYLGHKIRPYLEGGIGPSYNGMDIQELGIGFNFLSYGGVGVSFPIKDGMTMEVGYRLRHISNAGLDDRNHGVTSNQVQVGVSWAF